MAERIKGTAEIVQRPGGYCLVTVMGYLDDIALTRHVESLMAHEAYQPDALAIYDISQADTGGMNAETARRFYSRNKVALDSRRRVMTTIVVRDRLQFASTRQFFSFWDDERYQILFSLEEAEASVARLSDQSV